MTATVPRPAQTESPSVARPTRPGYRPDIQYLRAVAVGAVVLFHLWPAVLPGGYVGVDVFFAISGFLITGQLLAEAEETGRIRLGRFWARRIRRLLPAAFAVIAATLVAAWLLLPRETLRATLEQAIAIALYVENWLLGAAAVDYLDAENAPSPFQHFWSLSVEEQFHLLWPLLILAAALFTGRTGLRQRLAAIGAVLGSVVLLSLAASVLLTALAPEQAYFATHARAWEFGIGGLVAWGMRRGLGARLPERLRQLLWWTGIAAVLAAALLYSGGTPFPGAAALLPVLGTALSLLARPPRLGLPAARPLGRGAELVGAWSYSLYLWHWPVIVIALALVDGPLGPLLGLALLAGSVGLAALTERVVERPFRAAAWFSPSTVPVPAQRGRSAANTAPERHQWGRALLILLVGSALVAGPAAAGIAALDAQAAAEQAEIDGQLDELGANQDAPAGPSAAEPPAFPAPSSPALYPSPAHRLDDTEQQYACYVAAGRPYRPCGFGDPEAETRIAIIGDSHAGSWVPALVPIIQERGWRLDVLTGNGCRLVAEPECAAGDAMLTALRDGGYDAVLAASWRAEQADARRLAAEWRGLVEQGLSIVPIVDVPHFPEAADRCLAAAADALEAKDCWTASAAAGADAPDAYGLAGAELGLPVVDLTEQFCRAGRCPAVIGNAIVYRDSPYSHLTATFSRTLSQALAEQLVPILERLQGSRGAAGQPG